MELNITTLSSWLAKHRVFFNTLQRSRREVIQQLFSRGLVMMQCQLTSRLSHIHQGRTRWEHSSNRVGRDGISIGIAALHIDTKLAEQTVVRPIRHIPHEHSLQRIRLTNNPLRVLTIDLISFSKAKKTTGPCKCNRRTKQCCQRRNVSLLDCVLTKVHMLAKLVRFESSQGRCNISHESHLTKHQRTFNRTVIYKSTTSEVLCCTHCIL